VPDRITKYYGSYIFQTQEIGGSGHSNFEATLKNEPLTYKAIQGMADDLLADKSNNYKAVVTLNIVPLENDND
jgi:hypothetical protein